MTEQQLQPPRKKRASALKRQRMAALIGLGVVVLLTVAFIIVWTITSRIIFKDFDGQKYYVKSKGGVYYLQDTDGNQLPKDSDGNYITPADTIVYVDSSTGEYRVVAMVPVEGTERLQYDYYTGEYDVLMYPKLEREHIASIEIVNRLDHFKFVRTEEGTFILENYPGTPYDSTKFATLVNLAGYTATQLRLDLSDPKVAYGFAEHGYAEYGLPEEGEEETQYYIITSTEGVTHKVQIGNETPSGAGYYVRYVGRDSVYLMKKLEESDTISTLPKVMLCTMEDFITPLAVVPMSSTTYFDVTDFTLSRVPENLAETGKLEQIIQFSYEPIETRRGTFYANFPYVASGLLEGFMIHSYHADDCLQNLQLLTPLRTVQINRPDRPLDEGTFARDYGVAYALEFTYNQDRDTNQNVKESYYQTIWFSPMTASGTYYVFATIYDMVVEVNRSDLEFLEWTSFEWISSDVFSANLGFCKEISIRSDEATTAGVTGVSSVTFKLDNSDSPQDNNNGNIDTSAIRVVADYVENGVAKNGVGVNVSLFKLFYQTLIYTSLEGNAALSGEQMDAYREQGEAGANMTVRIVYEINGKEVVKEFSFYHYTARQSFVTLNGKGTFYMLRNRATKVLNDAGRVLTGDAATPINPQGKN